MDSISPKKTVRISHKHKFEESWMSHGIEVVSRKKLELYKKCYIKIQPMNLYRNAKSIEITITS